VWIDRSGDKATYSGELVQGAVDLHEVGLQEDLQLVNFGTEAGGGGLAAVAALG
jgi:hypothetical protein